jgi:hypothetical protein
MTLGRAGVAFSVWLAWLASAGDAFAQSAADASRFRPDSGGAGDLPSVEVSVHGTKRSSDDIGGDALKTADARATPGTFGDPLQALAAMPGISPMASGLPYFYLRGAPPADTGYFIDGVPVPALFHIGPGPSYVPPALLSRVELYKSTAPPQFGRFVGGIMAGMLTTPAFSSADAPAATHGEANLRLFDASAFVEAPVGDSWSVVAAGRYGYPDLLLSVFAPNLSLGYGDYTLRVAHALSPSDTVSVLALGGYDHETDASNSLPPIDTQFHRVDLRLDHRWSTGTLRLATTFGWDRTGGYNSGSAGEVDASTTNRLRLELDQRIDPGPGWGSMRLIAGADLLTTHYAYGGSADGPTTPIGNEEMVGAYAALRFVPAPGIEIVPGLRVDDTQRAALLPGGSGITVDPKLAARVGITRDFAWVATMGVAHQEPSYVLPIPGVVVTAQTGFQTVDQVAAGFEARLPWLGESATGKVMAFYNAAHQMSDFIASCGELLSCGPVGSSNGRTYGAEVFVRSDDVRLPGGVRLGGWLSYTLSRAERYLGSVPYLSPFDRTHDLSAVLRLDFGSGFTGGLRGTYYTGRPDFPSLDFSQGGSAAPQISFGPGEIAQHRLPSFYRVDWRFEKRWRLGGGGGPPPNPETGGASVAAVAEFFNTTLTKEAIEFLCSPFEGVCRATNVGPIALPSVGVEGRW